MALEGSIKEFNLADILQLLFFQRKTGVLTLQSKLDKIRLLFAEGNIVGAESRKRDVAGRLGRVLLARGIIDATALEKAIAKQKASGEKLGAILINDGVVTKAHIEEVLAFQIKETVNQLFSWKDGKYGFEAEEVSPDKDIPLSIDTQHLLMEGMRLLDEWSEIGDRVAIETVFLKRPHAALDGLTPEEIKVLQHVNGRNDILTIADLTGIDSLQVSFTLLNLGEKAIVEKKEEAMKRTELPPPPPPPAPLMPGLEWQLVLVFAVSLLIACAMVFALSGSGKKVFRASEEIDNLRTKIETYNAYNGMFPSSMEKTDPWGMPYEYRTDGTSFMLRSAGPDGKFGTPDDIR